MEMEPVLLRGQERKRTGPKGPFELVEELRSAV